MEGLGDALEGDFSEASKGSKDRGRRAGSCCEWRAEQRETEERKMKRKPTPTLVVFSLSHSHTILTRITTAA